MHTSVDGLDVGCCQLVVGRDTVLQQAADGGQVSQNTVLDGGQVPPQARPSALQEGNAAESRTDAFLKYLRVEFRTRSGVPGKPSPQETVLTWKKAALQHRGLCGGRGLLFPPLCSRKPRSRASSRSTILTADTNGVGFCLARARALPTTAHISLPAGDTHQKEREDHLRNHRGPQVALESGPCSHHGSMRSQAS